MVDFQSKYKHYGYRYNVPTPNTPSTATYRDLYRNSTPHLFNTTRVEVHDCREDVMKGFSEKQDWEVWMFSQGLKDTYSNINQLHSKHKDKEGSKSRCEWFSRCRDRYKASPDKLIYHVDVRGKENGELNYPRGIAITDDGDIIVADSRNHRVQIFNQCAFYKAKFGKHGSGKGEFNEPTDVSVLPNGDMAVVDRKNKRVQVFSGMGRYKYMFLTAEEPYSISCDDEYKMVVATLTQFIEIYRRDGKLVNRFCINNSASQSIGAPVYVCTNRLRKEIVVSDTANRFIKFFNYDGQLLYKFQPNANGDGLACHPAGLTLTPIGQVLVTDNLNHTVNLYSERGALLSQLLGPADDVGPVQNCHVGPEGHLVVTEFAGNGVHSLKVFRYRDCECHRTRPGSSKRPTRAASVAN